MNKIIKITIATLLLASSAYAVEIDYSKISTKDIVLTANHLNSLLQDSKVRLDSLNKSIEDQEVRLSKYKEEVISLQDQLKTTKKQKGVITYLFAVIATIHLIRFYARPLLAVGGIYGIVLCFSATIASVFICREVADFILLALSKFIP